MKRALVIGIMASCVFAGSLRAQSADPELPWVEVSTSSKSVIYVNVESIKDLGGGVKQAWELWNLNAFETADNGKKYISYKIKTKYHCIEEKANSLSYVGYSKKNGLGEAVEHFEFGKFEDDWSSAVPGSVGYTKLKFVCEYE